ncbi:acyl carrier protein [Saccharothrix sp. ST-888]|uniref:acyl carrier protein n=1 Tax=Saccharothrix sp. ST-888 TaxID=1427391 RepID=UPI0005ED08A0|nr:acyl carrier protein [Saccharothrix sp. ST-888]KJK57388.1 Curamycin polyketide synthase acyl carrier protein [Saccharothrix sp. ST-888]
MPTPLTHTELSALIKGKAGIFIDPQDLERPEITFEEFGVDSLGLLGVVGELENRHGVQIVDGAEMAKTPSEFLTAVNTSFSKVGS